MVVSGAERTVEERVRTDLGTVLLSADAEDARTAARTAERLHDEVVTHLGWDGTHRRSLVDAASLHDIGAALPGTSRHRHAVALIERAALPGRTDRERRVISCLVRFLQGPGPSLGFGPYARLSPDDRLVVDRLPPASASLTRSESHGTRPCATWPSRAMWTLTRCASSSGDLAASSTQAGSPRLARPCSSVSPARVSACRAVTAAHDRTLPEGRRYGLREVLAGEPSLQLVGTHRVGGPPRPRGSLRRIVDLHRDAAKAKRAPVILDRLAEAYPDARIALEFSDRWELLVATILSAQCTDRKVNEVTSTFFPTYPGPEAVAEAAIEDLEEHLRPTGFFRQKARNVQGAARRILEEHGGEVPDTMEELTTLPGVARKTANVVLSNGFGRHLGVVVDTHVRRIAQRLGLTRQTDPDRIERDLTRLFPEDRWLDVSDLLIAHGRRTCTAQRPRCEDCPVEDLCPSSQVAGRTDRWRSLRSS